VRASFPGESSKHIRLDSHRRKQRHRGKPYTNHPVSYLTVQEEKIMKERSTDDSGIKLLLQKYRNIF